MAERAFSRSIRSNRSHYHFHGSQVKARMVVQRRNVGCGEVHLATVSKNTYAGKTLM